MRTLRRNKLVALGLGVLVWVGFAIRGGTRSAPFADGPSSPEAAVAPVPAADGPGLAARGAGPARRDPQGAPEAERGRVEIRLVDERGQPVTSAVVSVDGVGGAQAVLGEDGVFRRADLCVGSHAAWVRSSVCAADVTRFEVAPGRTTPLTIPVHVGVRLGGVVRDPSGAPVPAATVRVLAPAADGGGDRVVGTVTTDAQGRFDVGNLPEGRLRLVAVGEGVDSLDDATEVTGASSDVPVRVARLGVARLKLLAPDGAALPETAEVNVGVPGDPDPYEDTVPIRDGAIVVAGFVGGDEQLVVDVAGYAAVVLTASIPPGKEADLGTAVLWAGHALAGVVVDAEGAPVSKALVTAAGERARGWTGDDGSFRLEGLPAGPVDVAARAEGYLPLEPREVVVGGAGKPARLVLRKAAVVLGRLQRADGAPAAGERLVMTALDPAIDPLLPAEHRAFRTEEDGTFRVEVPPGPYRVEAREGADALLLTEITLADGERRELPLVLPRR